MTSGEVVKFHVRGLRYGADMRSDEDEEFDSLERALRWIEFQLDPPGAGAVGLSCCHSIWIGDEMVYDREETTKLVDALPPWWKSLDTIVEVDE